MQPLAVQSIDAKLQRRQFLTAPMLLEVYRCRGAICVHSEFTTGVHIKMHRWNICCRCSVEHNVTAMIAKSDFRPLPKAIVKKDNAPNAIPPR